MANIHLVVTEEDFFRAVGDLYGGSIQIRRERLLWLLSTSRAQHLQFWRAQG